MLIYYIWQSLGEMLLSEKKKVGAIFIDLSEAFDTIDHSVLITKLKAYGVSADSLKFILSYLANRKQ